MNWERIVSSRLNPLKVSSLLKYNHRTCFWLVKGHMTCVSILSLCMSVGLSSHSRWNVCIFDKASNTRCILYPFLLQVFILYHHPPLSLPPPHTHKQPPWSCVLLYNSGAKQTPHPCDSYLPTPHTQGSRGGYPHFTRKPAWLVLSVWSVLLEKVTLSLILLGLEHHSHNIAISIVYFCCTKALSKILGKSFMLRTLASCWNKDILRWK